MMCKMMRIFIERLLPIEEVIPGPKILGFLSSHSIGPAPRRGAVMASSNWPVRPEANPWWALNEGTGRHWRKANLGPLSIGTPLAPMCPMQAFHRDICVLSPHAINRSGLVSSRGPVPKTWQSPRRCDSSASAAFELHIPGGWVAWPSICNCRRH